MVRPLPDTLLAHYSSASFYFVLHLYNLSSFGHAQNQVLKRFYECSLGATARLRGHPRQCRVALYTPSQPPSNRLWHQVSPQGRNCNWLPPPTLPNAPIPIVPATSCIERRLSRTAVLCVVLVSGISDPLQPSCHGHMAPASACPMQRRSTGHSCGGWVGGGGWPPSKTPPCKVRFPNREFFNSCTVPANKQINSCLYDSYRAVPRCWAHNEC